MTVRNSRGRHQFDLREGAGAAAIFCSRVLPPGEMSHDDTAAARAAATSRVLQTGFVNGGDTMMPRPFETSAKDCGRALSNLRGTLVAPPISR